MKHHLGKSRRQRPISLIFAALILLLCQTAQGQNSQSNQNDCVGDPVLTSGVFGKDFYTNKCKMPVGVLLIFPRGGSFAFDLKPNQRDGTGHSREDYENMGEPKVFVCTLGLRPTDDDTGKRVTLQTHRYMCKH